MSSLLHSGRGSALINKQQEAEGLLKSKSVRHKNPSTLVGPKLNLAGARRGSNWEPTLDKKGRINEKMLHQLGLYNTIKYRKMGVKATSEVEKNVEE
jgi:hypothetical protein